MAGASTSWNPRATPANAAQTGPRQPGVVVNLANWVNSNPPKHEAREPELTGNTIALGTNCGE
jgi:hypothetical protein